MGVIARGIVGTGGAVIGLAVTVGMMVTAREDEGNRGQGRDEEKSWKVGVHTELESENPLLFNLSFGLPCPWMCGIGLAAGHFRKAFFLDA